MTALLAFEFLTDPHFAYHPTQPSSDVILRPEAKELLAPLVDIIPLQLLSYETALRLGCDIDQPRNLAKSVTVE